MHHHLLCTKVSILELYSVLPSHQQYHLISSLFDVSSYPKSVLPLLSSLSQNATKSGGIDLATTLNIQSLGKKRKKPTMDETREQTIQALSYRLQTILLPKSQSKDQISYKVRNIFDIALVAVWIISSIFHHDVPGIDMTEKYKNVVGSCIVSDIHMHHTYIQNLFIQYSDTYLHLISTISLKLIS